MGVNNQEVDYLYLPPGTILNDKYLIKSKLVPKSNLSIVYLAVDYITKEKLVIKEFFPQKLVLRDLDGRKVVPKSSRNKALAKEVDFFLREGEIMKQFDHLGIGQCYDYFRDNNTGYIVFKYYQGPNLKGYITNNHLSFKKFLEEIFYPLLDIVAVVHKKGYIHRDLKPSNIIYNSHPILIDFGSVVEYKKEQKMLEKGQKVENKHGADSGMHGTKSKPAGSPTKRGAAGKKSEGIKASSKNKFDYKPLEQVYLDSNMPPYFFFIPDKKSWQVIIKKATTIKNEEELDLNDPAVL